MNWNYDAAMNRIRSTGLNIGSSNPVSQDYVNGSTAGQIAGTIFSLASMFGTAAIQNAQQTRAASDATYQQTSTIADATLNTFKDLKAVYDSENKKLQDLLDRKDAATNDSEANNALTTEHDNYQNVYTKNDAAIQAYNNAKADVDTLTKLKATVDKFDSEIGTADANVNAATANYNTIASNLPKLKCGILFKAGDSDVITKINNYYNEHLVPNGTNEDGTQKTRRDDVSEQLDIENYNNWKQQVDAAKQQKEAAEAEKNKLEDAKQTAINNVKLKTTDLGPVTADNISQLLVDAKTKMTEADTEINDSQNNPQGKISQFLTKKAEVDKNYKAMQSDSTDAGRKSLEEQIKAQEAKVEAAKQKMEIAKGQLKTQLDALVKLRYGMLKVANAEKLNNDSIAALKDDKAALRQMRHSKLTDLNGDGKINSEDKKMKKSALSSLKSFIKTDKANKKETKNMYRNASGDFAQSSGFGYTPARLAEINAKILEINSALL